MFDKPTPIGRILQFEGFDLEDLLLSATLYYLGRSTIAAGAHAQQLGRSWHNLSDFVRQQTQKYVEAAFERDDTARRLRRERSDYSSAGLPLGMDMDRRCWEQLRACWKEVES